MPFDYEYINTFQSQIQPGSVHSQDTVLVSYYRRYLMDRAISVFRWTLPESWDRAASYLKYCIYGIGFVAVINTDRFGVIPQHGTLSGRGVFYEPTHVLISNPLFNQGTMARINEDCCLLQLRPDYGGILDLINDYAEAMALTSQLFSVNTINSRLSYVFGANNKRAAESFKRAMDQLYAGDPMVVMDKELLGSSDSPGWQLLLPNVGQNYVAGEALENLRRLECKFDNEIGVPANLATNKKERTISAEVEANDVETYGRAAAWLELLQAGCKRARDMFGVDLSVDWRVDPMKSLEEVDVNADSVPAGDL